MGYDRTKTIHWFILKLLSYLCFIVQLEPVPAPVDEEAPTETLPEPETPVQQHADDMKDEEQPMEQEESSPVMQEEPVTVSQVRFSYS